MTEFRFFNPQNNKKVRVNIIPLIDIIFLMLVFFMLATNFSNKKQIDVSINNNFTEDSSDTKTLKLIIDSSGSYKIDNIIYQKENIEKQVLKIWKSNKFSDIFILNDKNAVMQDLVYIIEILRKNKIDKVYFSDLND